MSSTTPILSLNVHEALTFDGTEIVLHPDLFSDSPAVVSGGASIVSNATRVRPPTPSGASVMTGTAAPQALHHRHTLSDTAAASAMAIATSLFEQDGKVGPTESEENRTITPVTLSRHPSQQTLASNAVQDGTTSKSRLEVGNMIEIRVWDPLPSRDRRHPNNSSPASGTSGVFRRRGSPPSQSLVSSTKISASNSELADAKGGTGNSIATSLEAASPLQMSFLSNASLQYSVESSGATTQTERSHNLTAKEASKPSKSKQAETGSIPPKSPVRESNGTNLPTADASTLSSGERIKDDAIPEIAATTSSLQKDDVPKTVLAPSPPRTSTVPPLFPRSRANTGDAPPPRPSNTISKPPIVQRSRTSQSALPNEERAVRERRRPTTTQSVSAKPRSHHVRDISDMTADTIAFSSSGLGLNSEQQQQQQVFGADILSGVSFAESGEEGIDDDDLLSKVSTTHQLRLSFTMLVTEKTLSSIKGTTRTQVSILRQVADLYNLSSYDMVTITRIEQPDEARVLEEVSADFVMVTIKDQFISRGDMHYFQKSLIGRWIYEGERLSQSKTGVNAHAREIRHANRLARSGIITDNTTITFRSRSARIIWLVQISSEMWDYASPYEAEHGLKEDESSCEMYFDKFVTFMYRLFEKWKEIEATHSLTVVFFSRTFLGSKKHDEPSKRGQENANVDVDVYGRTYEDHYKAVIENETPSDWESLVLRIKREFVTYPIDVGWNFSPGDGGRRPSNAMQGNLLEAINVTLNLLHFHFMDRDLHRTGNSILIVSPGCGVFEVDKELSLITYQRMMDDGIGSDMLSLSLPPLHIAPFFLYNNDFFSVDTHGVDAGTAYYEVPHWMHLSFASYEKEETSLTTRAEELKSLDLNVSTTTSNSNSHPQNLNVAANGFLLPKIDPEQSAGVRSPPLFSNETEATSRLTHNASSLYSSQAHTHQRALISGRDFEDILEACRPRNSADSMPSALLSLLHMHHKAKELGTRSLQNDSMKPNSVESDTSSVGSDAIRALNSSFPKVDQRLTEWGTVDFNDMGGKIDRSSHSASILIRSEMESPLLAAENVESSEKSSEKSSPSSSFASVYSHMLGKPSDRGSSLGSYHQFLQPSAFGGIHIQRSPSLEFEPSVETGGEETDKAYQKDKFSEDSLSTMGTEDFRAEKSTPSSQSIDGVMVRSGVVSEKPSSVDYAEHLRAAMSQCDADFFAPSSNNGKRSMSDSSFLPGPMAAGGNTGGVRSMSHEIPNQKKGGLGAALLQYHNSDDQVVGNLNVDNLKRIRSVGMISAGPLGGGQQHGKGQFQDKDSRPMSPAFIGMPIGSDPPEHLQLHRHRGQAVLGDSALKTLLAPDGKAIQRLDGVAQLRNPAPSGNFFPLAGSAPSENLLYKTTAQAYAGQQPPSTRNSFVNTSFSSTVGISPPVDSKGVVSKSPPKGRDTGRIGQQTVVRKKGKRFRKSRGQQSASMKPAASARGSRQRKSVFNPFRQQDEEEVLAKKSHNRRRWSHVFPIGEIEFKRHAGPNWMSLCQPAILPLTIDFHPSPHELRDPSRFYFNHYSITLRALDSSYYTTNAELLLEMVRQRVTQDFQIVPHSVIQESARRGESERKAKLKRPIRGRREHTERKDFAGDDETIQHSLSMGHKIHKLTYNPSSDSVEVIMYNAASAMHDTRDVYNYRYMLYSESTKKYTRAVQTFQKYPNLSRWSKVDNIICGDSEKLTEEMRYRRINFGIIPEEFPDEAAEQEYIGKFKRLVEYLSRLQQTNESSNELDIEILSSKENRPEQATAPTRSRGPRASLRRFVVHLRKGKDDRYEWMELALEPTFDTRRSYRISVNWLVASASKVETQVQLLQRRCSQYGLRLHRFPQLSSFPNIFLYPFLAPPLIAIRDAGKAALLSDALIGRNFLHDGVHMTAPQFMDCIDHIDEFEFPLGFNKKPKNIPGQQFVHRSGTLFIRLLIDLKGKVILVALENTTHIGRDNEMRRIALSAFQDVSDYVATLET